MTRTEAISVITKQIQVLDDERVRLLADFARSMPVGLELSPSDQAALERSRADFKAGRVVDEDQYNARMDAFMERLRAKSQDRI